jgi:hypothetical protein
MVKVSEIYTTDVESWLVPVLNRSSIDGGSWPVAASCTILSGENEAPAVLYFESQLDVVWPASLWLASAVCTGSRCLRVRTTLSGGKSVHMCCSSANGPRNQKLILNSCFSTLDRISEKTQIWNEVFSYRRIDYFLRVLAPAARRRVSSDVRPMLPNHCDKLSRANLAVTAKSIGSSNSRLDWLPTIQKPHFPDWLTASAGPSWTTYCWPYSYMHAKNAQFTTLVVLLSWANNCHPRVLLLKKKKARVVKIMVHAWLM